MGFPICKGDGHDCYKGSCPNGGQCDHVEPMFGIYSNHSLDDSTVYADDWILHASDQDYEPYFRPMSTLEDDLRMEKIAAMLVLVLVKMKCILVLTRKLLMVWLSLESMSRALSQSLS